ncbi:MAG: alpha/beta hydrolase [Rhodospirillaceae bacterium]
MANFRQNEYWAENQGVKLYLFRKRLNDDRPRPVFFLVHGSSFSGPGGFDLHVPGKADFSFMEKFAGFGFDVWTLDHEGYGRSDRTDGNSDVLNAIPELEASMKIIETETGSTSAAFYGSSSGALRAAVFAEAHPNRVSKLILDAFVYTGKDAPTLIERTKKLSQWTSSNTRAIDRDFIHSIFTRDKPGTAEDGVADALADYELALGNTVPTGTYSDMCQKLPLCDPKKIQCPVQIIRGEHDGIATEEDLLNYYNELEVRDKQFIIIPGQAHVSHLGVNRARFWHVVKSFLEMPERTDQSGL